MTKNKKSVGRTFPSVSDADLDTKPAAAVSQPHLKFNWYILNTVRRERGLRPYSLTDLATFCGISESAPGQPINISKSTVAAVLKGAYNAATEPAIRKRITNVIATRYADLNIAFPCKKKLAHSETAATSSPKRRRPQRLSIIRCNNQGYLPYRGKTYYLGGLFAGSHCTVAPLRDRAHGIRITITSQAGQSFRRNASPIDPVGNQLGYKEPAIK